MKKVILLVLCAVLMLTMFAGCGGRDELEKIGLEAVEAADAYLEGKMDAGEAMAVMEDCLSRVPDNGEMKNTLIRAYITNMENGLFMAYQTEGQYYSGGYLFDQRNEFARYLEIPELPMP